MAAGRNTIKRVAIVSDFHAFDSATWVGDASPSYFDIAPGKNPAQCPITSLLSHIRNSSLKADILLCPGDLCDKGCASSLQVAWKKLHELGNALGVADIFATTGNHDVDSRGLHNVYDPIEALKSLKPTFPVNNPSLANHFWAHHFFLHESHDTRIVVLNSSAYHTKPEEVEHGRIADLTLELLQQALDESEDRHFNVLLCHHNPHKHSEINLGEHDEIRGGQQLLDLVGGTASGDWLVVHGHKHHPKLTYAAGGASSAVVFSAGSVSSTLYPDLITETGNQFYIVEIELERIPTQGLVGTFRSWDWHQGFDWREAEAKKGLPAIGGFGHRENPKALAARIVNLLKGTPNQHLVGDSLYHELPELAFVAPTDLVSLGRALESISAVCTFTDSGQIEEVAII